MRAALFPIALALGCAPAAAKFDFADRAHTGHFITLSFSTIGDRATHDLDGGTQVLREVGDGEVSTIYLHVSGRGEHFLFLGGCGEFEFEDLVRAGRGVELTDGEDAHFAFECPSADGDRFMDVTSGVASFSNSGSAIEISLDTARFRRETFGENEPTRILAESRQHRLDLGISYQDGREGSRLCRIDYVAELDATQTSQQFLETGRHDVEHMLTGKELSWQRECREMPSPFPPPPGTGQPIPPTPHATP